tara:strand:+ start:898 stop:1149 length:252 start_codon:yes stop_codon:yes gene_type:complete
MSVVVGGVAGERGVAVVEVNFGRAKKYYRLEASQGRENRGAKRDEQSNRVLPQSNATTLAALGENDGKAMFNKIKYEPHSPKQ